MKKNLAALVVLSATFILAFPVCGLLAGKTQDESENMVTKSYDVVYMPVWTFDHKFDETMLTSFLQASATPKLWKARGGTASMEVYKGNLKLVVTGPERTHKAIKRVLDQYSRLEDPAPSREASN